MTPVRQRKHDRLVTPGASAAEIAADFATAPFDRACREADRTWGIDRLPELVSPATAARFGKAMGVMLEAVDKGDADAAAAAALNCVKGLSVMDAEARAAGHQPITAEAWQYEYEGNRFVVIRDSAAWQAAEAAYPGQPVYTLQEVAVALAASRNAVVAVRDAFPGARLTAIRSAPLMLEEELEDAIPY